jgi:hypothetical protein
MCIASFGKTTVEVSGELSMAQSAVRRSSHAKASCEPVIANKVFMNASNLCTATLL